MTSQLLASELTNLIQESKRKHNDLRQVSPSSSSQLTTLRAVFPHFPTGHLIPN